MSVIGKSKGWIICICASFFFAYELVQFHVMNSLSSHLIVDLHLSAVQYGYLSSTYLFLALAFLIPAGAIVDRFAPKVVILSALAICIAGIVGFSKSHSLGYAAFWHALSGIGNAFCFISCVSLISGWIPKDRHGLAVGIMVMIGMLGGVVAQAPFSILANHFHWRDVFVIDAMVGVVIWILVLFVVKNPKNNVVPIDSKSLVSRLKLSFRSSHNICCGFYTCLMNLPLMVIGAVWGSLFLNHVHNIHNTQGSFISSMICAGTIIGSPTVGWITDKMGNRNAIMRVGAYMSVVLLLAIMFAPPLRPEVLTTLFFMLGVATSTQVLGYPAIQEHNPTYLVGTSTSVAAVIIMGIPAIIQPLSGMLLSLGWDGSYSGGVPLYSPSNFRLAFSIFPLGIMLSLKFLKHIKQPSHRLEVSSTYP